MLLRYYMGDPITTLFGQFYELTKFKLTYRGHEKSLAVGNMRILRIQDYDRWTFHSSQTVKSVTLILIHILGSRGFENSFSNSNWTINKLLLIQGHPSLYSKAIWSILKSKQRRTEYQNIFQTVIVVAVGLNKKCT